MKETLLIHLNDNKNIYLDLNKIFFNEDEKNLFLKQIYNNKLSVLKSVIKFLNNKFSNPNKINNIFLINKDTFKLKKFNSKSDYIRRININKIINYNKFIKKDTMRSKKRKNVNYKFTLFYNRLMLKQKYKEVKNLKIDLIENKENKSKCNKNLNKNKFQNIKNKTSLEKLYKLIKIKKLVDFKSKSNQQNFKKMKFFNIRYNINNNIKKFFISKFIFVDDNIFRIFKLLLYEKLKNNRVVILNEIENKQKKKDMLNNSFRKNVITRNFIKKFTLKIKNKKNNTIHKIKEKKKFIINRSPKKLIYNTGKKFFKKKFKFKLKLKTNKLKSFYLYRENLDSKRKLKKSFD